MKSTIMNHCNTAVVAVSMFSVIQIIFSYNFSSCEFFEIQKKSTETYSNQV